MSEVWNKVYKSDSSFFGEEPSNFALLCLNHMKTNNAKRVLEPGAGHGRDPKHTLELHLRILHSAFHLFLLLFVW
jgi:hypothetical protein